MTCPRCGTKTDSWPCPNCGFPVLWRCTGINRKQKPSRSQTQSWSSHDQREKKTIGRMDMKAERKDAARLANLVKLILSGLLLAVLLFRLQFGVCVRREEIVNEYRRAGSCP